MDTSLQWTVGAVTDGVCQVNQHLIHVLFRQCHDKINLHKRHMQYLTSVFKVCFVCSAVKHQDLDVAEKHIKESNLSIGLPIYRW